MKYLCVPLIAMTILFLPDSLWSQVVPAKTEQVNLDRVADDLKFQNGMQLLQLRQYDKAVEALSEYLEIFNDGTHRNEAYKSIARIYFDRFDYQKAVRTYRNLFEEFSTSDDGIEAYFQIGICYTKMGYENKAMEVFREIVDDYPDSGISSQARTQLDLLNVLQ